MKYFAQSSDKEYVIEVQNSGETLTVLLGGKPVHIDFSKIGDGNFFSMLRDGKSYQLFVEPNEHGYLVSVNGRKYVVELEDEKSRMVRKVIKSDAQKQGQVELKSPMPGLIVKINAEENQQVQRNDSLLIIEAMKMENEIRATSPGTIKKIMAREGDSVEKDTVLMIIES